MQAFTNFGSMLRAGSNGMWGKHMHSREADE